MVAPRMLTGVNVSCELKESSVAVVNTVTTQQVPLQTEQSEPVACMAKEYPTLQIKLLSKDVKLPEKGTSEAIGYDLYSPVNLTIAPNQREKIPLGFAMVPPPDSRIPEGPFGTGHRHHG